jgi:hypothetical protein
MRTFAALSGMVALLIVAVSLSAKGKTVRITIKGAALAGDGLPAAPSHYSATYQWREPTAS